MLPSHRPSLRASASRNQFWPATDRCGQNNFPSLFSQHPPEDGAIAGGPGLGSLLFPTTGPLPHRGGRTSSLGTLTGILLSPERNALYSLSPSVVCGQVGTLPCIFGVGVYGDSQGRNLPPTVGPSRSPRQDPAPLLPVGPSQSPRQAAVAWPSTLRHNLIQGVKWFISGQ